MATKTSINSQKAFSLTKRILKTIQKQPDNTDAYFDYFTAVNSFKDAQLANGVLKDVDTGARYKDMTQDMQEIHYDNRRLQRVIKEVMLNGGDVRTFYNLYGKSLLLEAPYNVEQYFLFLELNRPPQEKFYQPRMKSLHPLVMALQELLDGDLDELFLSQPPRTGKSTTLMFFETMVMGKHPLGSTLYSSYSNGITKAFYNGLLEVMRDPVTYQWEAVFPQSRIVQVNAQDQTINLVRKSRFCTATMRSIDGTLNGSCDCDTLMIADDLCSGIEQAMSKDRMANLWMKVSNDLLARCKQGAAKLWCGTRWAMVDPMGVRMEMLENDPMFRDVRWKCVNLPALDDNDESNFDYDYGVGFSTEAYRQTRATFERNNDVASWLAQYMGQPIEREGALFSSEDMRFYAGELPEGEPSRRFMAIDPAWGGSDFLAGPVCYQYDDDVYVPEVVFSNEDKRTTIPLLVQTIDRWKVGYVQIEANKMTEGFADELQEALRQKGVKCTVTTKPAPTTTSKEQRIFDRAPEIRESFIFLSSGNRTTTYQQFMNQVFSFTILKKNKHDDAPDSLAMAANMVFRRDNNRAQVFKRFI